MILTFASLRNPAGQNTIYMVYEAIARPSSVHAGKMFFDILSKTMLSTVAWCQAHSRHSKNIFMQGNTLMGNKKYITFQLLIQKKNSHKMWQTKDKDFKNPDEESGW